MRIALVSLDQRWINKEENYKRCVSFIRKAAENTCSLVIFPEMTLTGYCLDTKVIAERVMNSITLQRFGKLADEFGVNVIFGACLVDQISDQPRNSLCLARSNGMVESVYDKIHPFSFAGEDKVLEMGDKSAIIDIEDLKLGCSICYDLRFPELFSVLAPSCNAIINIANWPASRISHWQTLLLARAIENQTFVFGVNRIGKDGNNIEYEKSTIVVRPDGSLLPSLISEPEIDIYDVNFEEVTRYRSTFPTIQDKRYPLYLDLLRSLSC